MAEETMIEKAGFAVGMGLEAASEAAGAVKTAIDSAVTMVTGALKKAPTKKAMKTSVKKAAVEKPAKKAPAKNTSRKTAGKKVSAKKMPAKKTPVKKAATKSAKPAKKVSRGRR